jgi:uncharacterized protein
MLTKVSYQGYSNGALTASLHPVLTAPLRTTHVLISYPLGPRGLLTAFHTRTYQRALEDLVCDPGARVLICYGDADDFTGAYAYDEWAEALGKVAVGPEDGDRGGGEDEERHGEEAGASEEGEEDLPERGGKGLEVVKIPGASHFWGGHAGGGLIAAVTQFLAQGVGDGQGGDVLPSSL